jgi:hypothetical protein
LVIDEAACTLKVNIVIAALVVVAVVSRNFSSMPVSKSSVIRDVQL